MDDRFYDVATVLLAVIGLASVVIYLVFMSGFKEPSSGRTGVTDETVDRTFVLKSVASEGYAYRGMSESIRGRTNPKLVVEKGQVVRLVVVNGHAAVHDLVVPAFDVASDKLFSRNQRSSIRFRTNRSGTFEYYCSVGNHRQTGMEGTIVVQE